MFGLEIALPYALFGHSPVRMLLAKRLSRHGVQPGTVLPRATDLSGDEPSIKRVE